MVRIGGRAGRGVIVTWAVFAEFLLATRLFIGPFTDSVRPRIDYGTAGTVIVVVASMAATLVGLVAIVLPRRLSAQVRIPTAVAIVAVAVGLVPLVLPGLSTFDVQLVVPVILLVFEAIRLLYPDGTALGAR